MISRVLFGDSTNEIGRAILGFSGIHPVHIEKIGPFKGATDATKEEWKEGVYHLGMKAH